MKFYPAKTINSAVYRSVIENSEISSLIIECMLEGNIDISIIMH